MKVKISVVSENTKSGETKQTNTAYFKFVALDENGRTLTVPRLCPQTEEEQEIFAYEQQAYEQQRNSKNK